MSLTALRERPADIAPLAFALLLRHSPDGAPAPWISDAALAMLRMHGWPGNVRELENVMRRAQVLAAGKAEIRPEHIVFDRICGEVDALGQTAIRVPQSKGAAALYVQAQFDLGPDVRMWSEKGRDGTWMICFSTIPQSTGKVSWLAIPSGLPTPGA